jgi:hypothetical protein
VNVTEEEEEASWRLVMLKIDQTPGDKRASSEEAE